MSGAPDSAACAGASALPRAGACLRPANAASVYPAFRRARRRDGGLSAPIIRPRYPDAGAGRGIGRSARRRGWTSPAYRIAAVRPKTSTMTSPRASSMPRCILEPTSSAPRRIAVAGTVGVFASTPSISLQRRCQGSPCSGAGGSVRRANSTGVVAPAYRAIRVAGLCRRIVACAAKASGLVQNVLRPRRHLRGSGRLRPASPKPRSGPRLRRCEPWRAAGHGDMYSLQNRGRMQ